LFVAVVFEETAGLSKDDEECVKFDDDNDDGSTNGADSKQLGALLRP
jgi:hypothetical protein